MQTASVRAIRGAATTTGPSGCEEVETRVVRAFQEPLLRQDLFEEFRDEFTREMNRLRMEHGASLSAANRELKRVQNDIEAIKNGFAGPELRRGLEVSWNHTSRLLRVAAGQ
jgi:hypothetical protein